MTGFIDNHDNDIQSLALKFGSYAYVDKNRIINWLQQFKERDRSLALKTLQSITFYGPSEIISACTELGKIARGFFGTQLDNTSFFGLGAAGKSSGEILHRFRQVTGLHSTIHDSKFCFITQVSSLPKDFDGNLVFLDDFIGSGDQSVIYLNNILSVAPKNSKVILLVISGFTEAIEQVSKSTGCPIASIHLLPETDKVFSDYNPNFTDQEKTIIKTYCQNTGSQQPYGFNDTGALIAFSHGVPSNTISILNHDSRSWMSLFIRAY